MHLTVRSGPGPPRRVEVEGERLVVGRDRNCDLVLRDEQASWRHAAFTRSPSGGLVLEDLGSYNGTYVDGRRIEIPVSLRGGEEIRIGDTVLEASGGTRGSGRPEEPARSRRTAAIVAALACAVAAVAGVLLATGGLDGDEPPSAGEVTRAVRPSTVLVLTANRGRRTGSGSGWVLDAREGLVATSAHVLTPGQTFQVGMPAQRVEARVVGVSPCDDLAVLGVTGARGLVTPPLGSQRELRRGDTVVATGFPGNAASGAQFQSTVGTVTLPRTTFSAPGDPDLQRYPNVIQTDASLNQGNSGGPLVSRDKKVVGMSTATVRDGDASRGQSYAIAIDYARPVLRRLRGGRSIGWGGFGFRAISRGEQRKNDLPAGLLVRGVVAGTPAARSGLARGPALIVDIGGRRVRTFTDYCRAVRGIGNGEATEVGYFGRRGRQQTRLRFE